MTGSRWIPAATAAVGQSGDELPTRIGRADGAPIGPDAPDGAGAAGIATDRNAAHACVDALFDVHGRGLYRFFVVRCGDAHLADDLMQQLWLQARIGRPPQPPEQAAAWLWAAARNLVALHWRLARRRPAAALVEPAVARELGERMSREPLPAEWLERREVRDQLLLALTELSGPEQELLVGHYFVGQSLRALAEQSGASERAVEGRLYRARLALRERLVALET